MSLLVFWGVFLEVFFTFFFIDSRPVNNILWFYTQYLSKFFGPSYFVTALTVSFFNKSINIKFFLLFLFLALSVEITLFTTNWTWISCQTYGYYISSICSVLFQWWQNPWRCNAVLGIVGLAPSQQKVRQKIIGSKTLS